VGNARRGSESGLNGTLFRSFTNTASNVTTSELEPERRGEMSEMNRALSRLGGLLSCKIYCEGIATSYSYEALKSN